MRATLLVVIAVLLLAASAHAECAWVMWQGVAATNEPLVELGELRNLQTRLEEDLAPEYQRHFENLMTQGEQEEEGS